MNRVNIYRNQIPCVCKYNWPINLILNLMPIYTAKLYSDAAAGGLMLVLERQTDFVTVSFFWHSHSGK